MKIDKEEAEQEMIPDNDNAAMRIRRSYRTETKIKKYRGSYELSDELTQSVLASCDLIGKAVFAETEIKDAEGKSWKMAPNRKIMPSRWTISDPAGQVVAMLDQKIGGKLLNPLYRTALVICDAQGRELYRVVDPRQNIGDLIFGAQRGQWSVVSGERLVAKLGYLDRKGQTAKGFFGKLRRFLTGSDRAIFSAGGRHIMSPTVALGMILIFNEVTETSAE